MNIRSAFTSYRALNTALLITVIALSGCASTGLPGPSGDGPIATEVLAEWKRADRHYARGDFTKAQEGYETVRKRQPNNSEVLFRLANIAYYMQDTNRARELYDRVENAGVTDPQLFYNRAALNLTAAYEDLARHKNEVGQAQLTPEIRAVMAAIERMSRQRLPAPLDKQTAPSENLED